MLLSSASRIYLLRILNVHMFHVCIAPCVDSLVHKVSCVTRLRLHEGSDHSEGSLSRDVSGQQHQLPGYVTHLWRFALVRADDTVLKTTTSCIVLSDTSHWHRHVLLSQWRISFASMLQLQWILKTRNVSNTAS